MKTLGTPCSKFVLERNNGDSSLYSQREASKQGINFWASKKLVNSGFLGLVTLKHKAIHPISTSSFSTPSLSPEPEVNLETAEAGNQPTYQSMNTVQVKFQLQKQCSFGEQFMIVGDDPMFGLWDPANAIPLNWSEEHIWTVELDIPIGKSIQYKFILKGMKGIISWQPGPDRILKTWPTENRIIVCEDWENPGFQKIMEEDALPCQNDAEPNVTPEMLIAADILTYQAEDLVSEMDNGAAIPNMNPQQAKQSSLLPQERPIVADNSAHPQEKPLAVVADNISYLKDNPSVNANKEVLVGERNSFPKEAESLATLNHSENSLGSNGRVPTVMNSSGSDIQGNMIPYDGDPVLVPGLPPLSVVQSDSANHDEGERSIDFDASLGVNEVKNHNLPELDEKRENENDRSHHLKQIEAINNKQQIHMECKQNQLDEERIEHEPEHDENNILHNDIQWGRRTLQKFLANFGLQL